MQVDIQTENSSVQTLQTLKKMLPKNEEEKKKVVLWYISQGSNELSSVLFKTTSYTAKKKWLKVCRVIQISKTGKDERWADPQLKTSQNFFRMRHWIENSLNNFLSFSKSHCKGESFRSNRSSRSQIFFKTLFFCC